MNGKTIALAGVAGLVTFGLVYLVGAFVAASFDIVEWGQFWRLMVGLFGCFASVGVAVTTGEALRHDH